MRKEKIRVSDNIKYLAITLDGSLNFGRHFERLVPWVEKLALHQGRLLYNVGEPRLQVRWLYINILKYIVIYGSPSWSLHIKNVGAMILSRIQRLMARR